MSPQNSQPRPEGSRLRVRMYRQGIGDCFLLTFYGQEPPSQVLIDCGVLSGTSGGKDKIRRVAQNVAAETGGKLAALVATHEHWDHVGGFLDAGDIFDPMEVGEVWVAWTEDPDNPLARDLKRQQGLRLQAINLALAHMAKSDDALVQSYGQGIAGLMGFFGGPMEGATLAAFSEKTGEAMKRVTGRRPSPAYWKPGDLIERPWLPNFRFYVLGPPLDPKKLKQRESKGGTETYGLAGGDGAFAAALEQALAVGEEADEPERRERLMSVLPFHPSLQWRDEALIGKHPHLGPLHREYQGEAEKWRRIDHDWFLSAARLGLQLDSATNNTSLVLAIELTDTGEVLLFPADAQIPSWRTWQQLTWNLGGAEGKVVRGADLLRRTVFYKVGHHGSHNATLKEGGLELMTSPKLAAALPVDREFANVTKHWEMPAPALEKRLKELTRGRLLAADATWPREGDQRPGGLTAEDWEQFRGAVRLDPDGLFIDYYV